MTTTLAIRFPLGRYHATPWDRSVNEGATEWPPSPWRLLRSLVATWYNRWPELPAPTLDALLAELDEPPAFWTAPATPAHTRHYLPDPDRNPGETGHTDLTLDPFLSLARDGDQLLVQWEVSLSPEHRATLAKLVELVPYLGRAESACDIRLLDDDPQPDETWWRPGVRGAEEARLLTPTRPVQRPILELTTVAVRKDRRAIPPETEWVGYGRTPAAAPTKARRTPTTATALTAVRLAVVSDAPFRAVSGVLLADQLHQVVTRKLDGGREGFIGHGGARTDHRHAHWVPLPESADPGAAVLSVLVWVPIGLTQEEITASLAVRRLTGRRGDYRLPNFPTTQLLVQAVGPVAQVAPELVGPSRRWRSLTPYLPVRHRKPNRESEPEFLLTDIQRELGYRELPSAASIRIDRYSGDPWCLGFRRYREAMRDARPGFGLTVTFDEPMHGPLLLGQLSHFGFGIFVPDGEAPL